MQSNEKVLTGFKNKYPRNMSDVIEHNVPKIVITLSIILFAGILTFNIIIGAMAVLMGPMLLSFGLKLKKKESEKKADTRVDKLTAKEIIDINDKLKIKYGDYPDVKEYIEKFKAQTRQVDMHKKKLISRFNTWYTIVIIAISVTFFCMMIVNLKDRLSHFSIPQKADTFSSILKIEDNEPLLTLTPFDSKIADGYEIENQNLDFYMTDYRYISTKGVKIDGATPDDEFILWIVDSTGNSFDRCPQFNFKCTDETIEAQPRYYKSDFTLLNAFVNLKDNAKNLKFKIEKVEE
ncbi:MAG: hypothetical protein J5542_08640 [Bacteroidales bacterium]|nr:hypothetical protein [Bacteroidales bacterium]